jgi:chromosome segregation protein
MTLEQRSMELRTEEKERSGEKEAMGRELSRLEEQKRSLQRRYDEIIEQLWTEYELTRREAEQETSPVENAEEGAIKLKDLKSRIKKLGNVNLSAIEEYAEVSERYEFLTTQVADVEKSRTELRRLIRELTGQMTEIFKERFAEINGYFQTTFTELFGGGKARLELSDPENVLESGIVILAQPPGKIVKNLELLSGGEKALVAVSLYFSIMKCSPPPFCMLDEIEAALDDVNVVRFAEYLRRMNENTQFIVITHRRGTMEEADILYGVTMQEEGISKLLRLNPSEVGSQMGLK